MSRTRGICVAGLITALGGAALATQAVTSYAGATSATPRSATVAARPDPIFISTSKIALRSTRLGNILVIANTGRTLYLYTKDGKNKSNCAGGCASAWPPVLTNAVPKAGRGVTQSKLGRIARGKSHQVTYAGHPLYGFVSDTKPGQTTGQGAAVGGGTFYVVLATGQPSGKR